MKNSTLIALHEANELPEALKREWSSKNHRNPIYDAKQEIRRQKDYSRIGWGLLGIAIMAMVSVFLVISAHKWKAEIPFVVASYLLTFFLVFCVLSFGAAVIFIAVFANDSQSDFGTQLEKLREVLWLNYGEMCVQKIEDLRVRAENTLRAQAEHTKTLQGPNGEVSLSDEAKGARARYEEIHTILFAFGLCEEKWDKYWKAPEPENKKEEVGGTA